MDEPFSSIDAQTEKLIFASLDSLRKKGKTVVCVHHALTTVPKYFDNVLLLNKRVIASGSVQHVFNDENLAKTYGGNLTILEKVSHAIKETKL